MKCMLGFFRSGCHLDRPFEIHNTVQESKTSVSMQVAHWSVCGEHVLFVWYGNSIIMDTFVWCSPILLPWLIFLHSNVTMC